MYQWSPSSLFSIQDVIIQLANYIDSNITIENVGVQESTLTGIRLTIIDLIINIEAYYIQLVLLQELSLLNNLEIGGMGLDPQDVTFINNRLASMTYIANTIYTLPLWENVNFSNLQLGLSAITSFDLLSYLVTTNAETIPFGLSVSNFMSNTQAAATAWYDALLYLANSAPPYQVITYDAVNRMYQSSQDDYNLLYYFFDTTDFSLSNNISVTTAWNTTVSTPSILRVADLLSNDPSLQTYQAVNTFKYLLFLMLQQVNAVLTSFGTAGFPAVPLTATLRQGESLMDFANRTTGNYENWVNIAQINNLLPPYVGTMAAPNIATPGTKLYLQPIPVTQVPLADYDNTYLGTDIYFGNVGTTLKTWLGDFQLISGVPNYVQALYRRVLTPLGTLIFHNNYGSALPSRIGAVQSILEIPFLSVYLKTALLSDPRTLNVSNMQTIPLGNGQVALQAQVTPTGQQPQNLFELILTRNNLPPQG